jgi:Fe-S-cluster containining protein
MNDSDFSGRGSVPHILAVQPKDSLRAISAKGLTARRRDGELQFLQPCPAHDGNCCRIYADRPQRCRAFDCRQLLGVAAGHAVRGCFLGSTTKKQKDQISIYFTYDLKEKRLFATRPALRSSSNHKQDLSKYCDALDENVWEKKLSIIDLKN